MRNISNEMEKKKSL
jgi:hypothetical protein